MPKFRINGVIGEEFRVADLHAFLASANGSAVEIVINSPGGSVFAGIEAYNALTEYKGLVTTIVDALAASAASIIFCAGDQRVMLRGSLCMLHRASGATFGNVKDHEHTAEVLAKVDRAVIGIYVKATGLPESRIERMLDDETWLSSDEALKIRLATAASMQAVSAKIAAFLQHIQTHFHPPREVFAMATDQGNPKMPTPNKPEPVVQGAAAQIFALCKTAKLDMNATDNILTKAGDDLAKARDLIIEMLAARDNEPIIPGNGEGDRHPLASAVEEVIYARMTSQPIKTDSPAKQFEGRSLLDIGAVLLQANGIKIKSWMKDRLAQQVMMEGGMHSTSDFPILTASAGQRVLAEAYQAAASPLKQVARRRSAQDFRAIMVARLGEMPALLKVPEGGEVTYGSRTEAKEAFSISTYARIFAITRQALINDDLSAFSDSVRAWGQAAASLEADQLVALINGGGVVMDDNKSLFHDDHVNLIDDPLSVAGLTSARMKLRSQKGLDGVTPINVTPRYLVVGPENETIGEAVVTAITPSTVDEVNVFAGGNLLVLVEPRITDAQWFLFSEPSTAEVISYAYLQDREAPMLDVKDGWTVLGSEFRCVHDFGAGAVGVRGAVRSTGEGTS